MFKAFMFLGFSSTTSRGLLILKFKCKTKNILEPTAKLRQIIVFYCNVLEISFDDRFFENDLPLAFLWTVHF